jgi:hypothetical protein
LGKIRFYLNESVNIAVASGLRRRGVHAITAKDSGNLGISDSKQLEYSSQNDLVIVTHDDDFLSLAINEKHSGIIYIHQQKYFVGDLIRHLKLLWDMVDAKEIKNHIEFI